MDGQSSAGALPHWILRAAEPVRAWYVVAFGLGVDGEAMARIGRMDPLDGIAPRGTPINLLSLDAQRLAVANAYAIALARADGNAESYARHVADLEALQTRLKWCKPTRDGCRPGNQPPGSVLGIWSNDIRRAFARLAKPIAAYETRSHHVEKVILAILAIFGLVCAWRFTHGT